MQAAKALSTDDFDQLGIRPDDKGPGYRTAMAQARHEKGEKVKEYLEQMRQNTLARMSARQAAPDEDPNSSKEI